MLLPPMQTDLRLTNTETGGLATGNFAGYLVLAVVGGVIASRYGARRVIGISMCLTGTAMVFTGLTNSFEGALFWRALTGVGSAGSNVPVMALLPAWFAARRRGMAAGIAVGGSGLGLIIVGPLVPRLLASFGENGWRVSWFILGGLVWVLGIVAFMLLRERPEDLGLLPVATTKPRPPVQMVPEVRAPLDWSRVYRSRAVWHLALVYVAFGFSYVIYGTFFARYLEAEGGYTREAAGRLWALVGWLSVFCGLIWGAISDLVGRKYGLALVFLIQAVCYAVFALWHSPVGATVSAVMFGLTAWSIPGIMTAACGDHVGAALAPAAFGFVTLFFGLGQAAGPSVAGAVADATGSFGPAYLVAAGVAFVGSVGSLLLRQPAGEEWESPSGLHPWLEEGGVR